MYTCTILKPLKEDDVYKMNVCIFFKFVFGIMYNTYHLPCATNMIGLKIRDSQYSDNRRFLCRLLLAVDTQSTRGIC